MISLQLHAVMTACLVGHIAYRLSLLPHGDSQQLEKSINGISTAKYRQLTFPRTQPALVYRKYEALFGTLQQRMNLDDKLVAPPDWSNGKLEPRGPFITMFHVPSSANRTMPM